MRILFSHSRWAFLLLLAVGMLSWVGCASTESENMSERPWNTPQTWENGLPSGMLDQHR